MTCSLRFLLVFLPFGCAELEPPAAATAALDPRIHLLEQHGVSDVSVLIEGSPSDEQLAAIGVRVDTRAGDVITARIPLAVISRLATLSDVTRISIASEITFASDVSVPEIGAPTVWARRGDIVPPIYDGNAGRNVVVGIVDTGIDPRHADFRRTDGTSRIKYAWDQQWSGLPPVGFGYGVEFTGTQIDAGQAPEFTDYGGHGTHLAGVAAGNGRATGNGMPAYRHVGVAPEADLIIVKVWPYESNVIDAVSYIFARAALLGRPAVVNLSLGTQKGAHDGTHAFDRALSDLTGPGKIITTAMGNDAELAAHASADLAPGASIEIPFTIPTYTPSSTRTEYLIIEMWHAPTATFEVSLRSPTGIVTAVPTPGISSGYVETTDGTVLVENAVGDNNAPPPTDEAPYVRLAKRGTLMIAYGTPGTARPRSGTWTMRLHRRANTTTGRIDLWVADSFFATTVRPRFTGNVDQRVTLRSPASGDAIIATGSYASKTSFANNVGSTTSIGGSYVLGAIAPASGQGPRRDGAVRPDLIAPGHGVLAARSSAAPSSATNQDPDGVHHLIQGTSVASAHTAGVVALILADYPDFDPAMMRSELRARARPYYLDGSAPHPAVGWGKLGARPFVRIDPARSSVTAVMVGTPRGTALPLRSPYAGFVIEVKDDTGAPVAGVPVKIELPATLRLFTTQGTGVVVDCAARTLSAIADANGRVILAPRFGGFDNAPTVRVSAGDWHLAWVPVRSTDYDRSGDTGLADFAAFGTAMLTTQAAWADFNLDGSVGLADFVVFAAEMQSGVSAPRCAE